MGVSKYTARGRTWWRVDEWLTLPDGKLIRYRKKRIPTKEQAGVLAAKKKAEAFEGQFFARQKREVTKTVKELWETYEPISKRDNDSWQTNIGRARHLLRHLGSRRAAQLTLRTSTRTETHGSLRSPAGRQLPLRAPWIVRWLCFAAS